MSLRTVVFSFALVVAVHRPATAQTQQRSNQPAYYPPSNRTTPGTTPNANASGFPDFDSPDHEVFAKKMLEARKLERKKRMVDTANRLLVLTKQLQTDLHGREATPDDQKRLDEIARLARVVKDQMRN